MEGGGGGRGGWGEILSRPYNANVWTTVLCGCHIPQRRVLVKLNDLGLHPVWHLSLHHLAEAPDTTPPSHENPLVQGGRKAG
jgi:hypothetical protein